MAAVAAGAVMAAATGAAPLAGAVAEVPLLAACVKKTYLGAKIRYFFRLFFGMFTQCTKNVLFQRNFACTYYTCQKIHYSNFFDDFKFIFR
jgi:hypothetical protein